MNRTMYCKTGKCIWCNKEYPEVTFLDAPHILPKALGGQEIGFDVCDSCNHYFGTSVPRLQSTNVVFKEIFNATRFAMQEHNVNSWKNFGSCFFKYQHSSSKFIINKRFSERVITKQFKRSLYEVFLQKYHKQTLDGNNPKFAAVRDFARYGNGDLRVYYAFNNIVLSPDMNEPPSLTMNEESIQIMNETGVFLFWFLGHPLYLEVFPTRFNVHGYTYLEKEANDMIIPVKGNECIFELQSIYQMDFFMTRFNKSPQSHK